MRYIRRKDNHKVVRGYGEVPSGGLGEFDENFFEEVEGPIPEGVIFDIPPKKDLVTALSEAVEFLLYEISIITSEAKPEASMRIAEIQKYR